MFIGNRNQMTVSSFGATCSRNEGIVIYITLLKRAIEHRCLEVIYKHCVPLGFRRLEHLAKKGR